MFQKTFKKEREWGKLEHHAFQNTFHIKKRKKENYVYQKIREKKSRKGGMEILNKDCVNEKVFQRENAVLKVVNSDDIDGINYT